MTQRALILTLVAALLGGSAAAAEVFEIDKVHSETSFKVRHFVSKVPGRFTDFSGTIHLDEKDVTASSVHFSIQAASIDTDNADRDDHLRSDDFFAVEKFPTITFRSKAIRDLGDNRFAVMGFLTMRGVTKEITLEVTFLGTMHDPRGKLRAGFETSTKLNRKDYGINWNRALDAGGVVLGDEVEVTINIEAVQASPKPAE